MSQQSSPPGFDAANTQAPYAIYSKVVVGVFIALFLVMFFILMVHVYVKSFLQRSSRSYTINRGITFVSPSAAASAHINTGLDKAAIAHLPTFVYKAPSPVHNLEAGKLDESVVRPSLECAVCLSEFQENEKGRMLPSCKHTFHTECIDMWFFSHSTCPLCRAKVMPVMAPLPTMASTPEQHHEGEAHEAMEPLPSTLPGNRVVSSAVECNCTVLFWGNQTRVVLLQEPSCSSLPLSQPLRMSAARALPHVTIDMPPAEGNLVVSASGPLSTTCTTEEEACSSQPFMSPGLRVSIKRMLSRQPSRHKSSSHEDYEECPK